MFFHTIFSLFVKSSFSFKKLYTASFLQSSFLILFISSRERLPLISLKSSLPSFIALFMAVYSIVYTTKTKQINFIFRYINYKQDACKS